MRDSDTQIAWKELLTRYSEKYSRQWLRRRCRRKSKRTVLTVHSESEEIRYEEEEEHVEVEVYLMR